MRALKVRSYGAQPLVRAPKARSHGTRPSVHDRVGTFASLPIKTCWIKSETSKSNTIDQDLIFH